MSVRCELLFAIVVVVVVVGNGDGVDVGGFLFVRMRISHQQHNHLTSDIQL
jgi:hypothetical protein